jgi:Ca2+/Na+ antiporter
VGSNLFNILAVAGPVGLIRNLDEESGSQAKAVLGLDLSPLQIQVLCMMALTVMVFSMIILGRGRIGRKRGFSLIVAYALIMFTWSTI